MTKDRVDFHFREGFDKIGITTDVVVDTLSHLANVAGLASGYDMGFCPSSQIKNYKFAKRGLLKVNCVRSNKDRGI